MRHLAWCISLALTTHLVTIPVSAAEITGTVTYVRDGDTIEVDGAAIRLQGVAAHEMDERGGLEAATYMLQLVQGQQVTCELTGERSFDRLVGVCRLDDEATVGDGDTDIGAIMIQAGLARDCPRFSGGRYRDLEMDASRALPLPAYCTP